MPKITPSAQREAEAARAAQAEHEACMNEFRMRLHAAAPGFIAAWDQMATIIAEHMAYQGFNGQKNFAADIALMHSELSEALEADRKGALDDKLIQREGRAVELADAVIRILHAQEKHALESVGQLVFEKGLFNTTRPYKHGKGY